MSIEVFRGVDALMAWLFDFACASAFCRCGYQGPCPVTSKRRQKDSPCEVLCCADQRADQRLINGPRSARRLERRSEVDGCEGVAGVLIRRAHLVGLGSGLGLRLGLGHGFRLYRR